MLPLATSWPSGRLRPPKFDQPRLWRDPECTLRLEQESGSIHAHRTEGRNRDSQTTEIPDRPAPLPSSGHGRRNHASKSNAPVAARTRAEFPPMNRNCRRPPLASSPGGTIAPHEERETLRASLWRTAQVQSLLLSCDASSSAPGLSRPNLLIAPVLSDSKKPLNRPAFRLRKQQRVRSWMP